MKNSEKLIFPSPPPMTCVDVMNVEAEGHYDEAVGLLRSSIVFDDHIEFPIPMAKIDRIDVGFYEDAYPEKIRMTRCDSWWSLLLLAMENLGSSDRFERGEWSIADYPMQNAIICVTMVGGRVFDVVIPFNGFLAWMMVSVDKAEVLGICQHVIEAFEACRDGHAIMDETLPCFGVFVFGPEDEEPPRYRCGCFQHFEGVKVFIEEMLGYNEHLNFGIRYIRDKDCVIQMMLEPWSYEEKLEELHAIIAPRGPTS